MSSNTRSERLLRVLLALGLTTTLCQGCARDNTPFGDDEVGGLSQETDGEDTSESPGDSEGGESGGNEDDEGIDEDPTLFDVGNPDDAGDGSPDGSDPCGLIDELDGIGTVMTAPPGSFEPDIQWAWEGDGLYRNVVVTPAVGNLTDDDGDGDIDLCDTPDIVVPVYGWENGLSSTRIYVLDGATGSVHFWIDDPEDSPYPDLQNTGGIALGDIDDDGMMEIIVGSGNSRRAYEHDGALKWQVLGYLGSTLSLVDIDNDGDVEILGGGGVVDHHGDMVLPAGDNSALLPIAADLDGDEDMELIYTGTAIHHDGTPYFSSSNSEFFDSYDAYPQVADIDEDGLPEIIFTSEYGITILEHDGSTKVSQLRPTGEEPSSLNWHRPANIHDYDGDGEAEIAVKSGTYYLVMEWDGTLLWKTAVNEVSNTGSGGTAFDFLGDGSAEGIYADNHNMFIFDDKGEKLLVIDRSSYTAIEYPVVVDVDNDGSAEIVVVSNDGGSPPLQVIRDKEDRWVPARRIWNQHAYHITNVREDGSIPRVEIPHWTTNNTFRTQSQITIGTTPNPVG